MFDLLLDLLNFRSTAVNLDNFKLSRIKFIEYFRNNWKTKREAFIALYTYSVLNEYTQKVQKMVSNYHDSIMIYGFKIISCSLVTRRTTFLEKTIKRPHTAIRKDRISKDSALQPIIKLEARTL